MLAGEKGLHPRASYLPGFYIYDYTFILQTVPICKTILAAKDSQFKMRLLSLFIKVHYLNINVSTIGFILVPEIYNEFENNVYHIYLIYLSFQVMMLFFSLL